MSADDEDNGEDDDNVGGSEVSRTINTVRTVTHCDLDGAGRRMGKKDISRLA